VNSVPFRKLGHRASSPAVHSNGSGVTAEVVAASGPNDGGNGAAAKQL